jgi:myosin heavy subunit
LAGEINSIKSQTRQMIMSASIEIGRRLVDAKELCEHGQWGNWLKNKVDYSQRTAENLMKIFEEYGNGQISLFGKAKSQALADLGYTQAVALLSLPAEQREEFVEQNDMDAMTTRELQEAIKAKNEAEKALQEKSVELDEMQFEIDRQNAMISQLQETSENTELVEENQRLLAQLEEKKKDYEDSQEEIDRLLDEINEAQENEISSEELEKLKAQLAKEKENNKKLAAELKKPKEKEIVEVVPEAITKELEQLRQKLANEDSPIIAKFRLQFEGIQNEFTRLMQTTDEVSSADEATGAKLRSAIKAMLNKMIDGME